MIDDAQKALAQLPTMVDISRSSKKEPKRWALTVYDDFVTYYVGYFWMKNSAISAAVEVVEQVTKVKDR